MTQDAKTRGRRATTAARAGRPAPVRAPELDAPGVVRLGASAPPSLAASRGRVVVLDFWTLGCVNCLHVVPTLRRAEEAFGDEVTVIGVHSPKFDAERDPERVRQAAERLGLRHPVVHDPDRRLWDAYAVRAWPTLIVIDADGRIAWQVVGEPDPDAFLRAVAELVEEARGRGTRRPAPPRRAATEPAPPATPLAASGTAPPAPAPHPSPAPATGRFSFPGKIAPVPWGDRAFAVADGGHHRIVLLDGGGREIARYGTGRAGFRDGDPGTAAFAHPQGIVADASTLYVADAGNHAVRAVDRATGRVSTVAGTGGRGRILTATAEAARTALASPWDVALDGRRLYVANAGTHQLAFVDLDTGRAGPLAGAGGENLVDGPAREALLAQPSGLALDAAARRLYFVDAESSAVRVLSLGGDPEVTTLVGTGVFAWGHANGPLSDARLQHPLGIALHDGGLVIADAYNDALRRIDLDAGTVSDLGDGFVCHDPVCLPLAEPGGVAVDPAAARLLVADTNHHRVLAFDLEARTYRTWAA